MQFDWDGRTQQRPARKQTTTEVFIATVETFFIYIVHSIQKEKVDCIFYTKVFPTYIAWLISKEELLVAQSFLQNSQILLSKLKNFFSWMNAQSMSLHFLCAFPRVSQLKDYIEDWVGNTWSKSMLKAQFASLQKITIQSFYSMFI